MLGSITEANASIAPAMYPMSITINAHQAMSFEQFQETFRQAFGREMNQDERTWFDPVFSDSPGGSFSFNQPEPWATYPRAVCEGGREATALDFVFREKMSVEEQ